MANVSPFLDTNFLLILRSSIPTDEPPKLVAAQLSAWNTALASAAVISTLFCGIAAQFLGVIRQDDATQNAIGSRLTLVHMSSYLAILFNGIATVASGILIDSLGDTVLNQASSKYQGNGNTISYMWATEDRTFSIVITAVFTPVILILAVTTLADGRR
ncbi:hypothetical protein R3P38DRAFT_3520920 [Favolaschia claudopus]|uniref:Uncharacterized protein n=1 Tax=Favolaschia claudopus TaxID=2862362 RepID=A0AAW0BNH1_9AGAR